MTRDALALSFAKCLNPSLQGVSIKPPPGNEVDRVSPADQEIR